MEKNIPIYFDSVVVSSPFQGISESNPNIGRLKVRVFTKYGNRNGSYITEEVANQLIESATQGNTPVVGFFDPATNSWASHSGPALANAYGYVENFIGWEPFEDTDGVTRDYAVFSVVLFTDYFEEASKILGQNQSMELDPESITGAWTTIENQEYYVYTTAKMLGFCIIGEHEPCFSVSSFFSKNDDTYNNQFEKFSSLLFDLRTKVEEAEKELEGGEQPMNELDNIEVVESVATPEEPEVQFSDESEHEEVQENVAEPEINSEEPVAEPEQMSEFEALQQQYNDLQASYNELQSNYDAAQARLTEAEAFQSSANTELETLRNQVAELQTSLQAYEDAAVSAENARKEELVEKYEKILKEEEITPIKGQINDFSYDELESKLAVIYARKQIEDAADPANKISVLTPPESEFALLMKQYRKN